MKPIPTSVKDHIANAKHFIEAAAKFPSPINDSVHILLLLLAWENIVIADEELSAWARETEVDEKVRRDHARKFRDAPIVTRIILGPSGTKPREIVFSTGHDFKKLREACQYGSDIEGASVAELFKQGWHLDDLRNGLINKVDWVEMMLGIYKKL